MSLGTDVSISLRVAAFSVHTCARKCGVPVFFFFFGAKMKGSQLGSKRDSEHFVSQQVGELQEFRETSLSFLGVIYRVRLLRWSPNKHKDLKCVKHGKLT